MNPLRSARPAAIAAGYIAVYVLLDWLSYIHPVYPLAITPWNPPPALSLALLLRFGMHYWPALFLAPLTAELLVRGMPAPLPYTLAACGLLTAGYGGAAALLIGPLRFNPRFESLRDVALLLAVAVPLTLILGFLFVGIYRGAGLIESALYLGSVVRFFAGDLVGIVVLLPFLLVRAARRPAAPFGLVELLQAGSVPAALWVVFGVEYTDDFQFFYLLFLPLIWIGMRHGIGGSTAAIMAVQLGLVAGLQASGYWPGKMLRFEFLMLALAITGLFLGMAVSERRRAEAALTRREAELNQALRLASAGETASALAHELHQPLAAISNYVASCSKLLGRPEPDLPLLREVAGKVGREVERAAETVRWLREFFQSGARRPERIEVAVLVRRSVAAMKRRLDRQGIELIPEIASDLPAVEVDPLQMETVLYNLVVNGVEAMEGAGTPAPAIRLRAFASGAGITLCVSDNGPGIDPSVREQLFHPFATTKPQGMGLGLAISRTLVEANGGRLFLEPGATGARFCITLPSSHRTAQPMP